MPYVNLKIDSLIINQRGPADNAEDTNTIEFSLYYPAPGVNLVKTIKTIDASEKIPVFSTLERKDRIVFYCEVMDDFELEISTNTVDNPSDLAKFIIGVFGAAFKTAFSTATGGIQNVLTGIVLNQLGDAANSKIEALSAAQPLGSARVFISKAELQKIHKKGEHKLELDLAIPKKSALLRAWGNPNYEYPIGGHDVLVGPGEVNGKIELTLSVA